MSEETSNHKIYSNGNISIVWKPDVCIHSTKCFKGLGEVFDPKARPWINMEGASSEAIINQVEKCPSGALSWFSNTEGSKSEDQSETEIEITKNGPLLVKGNFTMRFSDGSTKLLKENTALCRCGNSSNKPFCDGTHRKVNFNDHTY